MTNTTTREGFLSDATWSAVEAGDARALSSQRLVEAIRAHGRCFVLTVLACVALGLGIKLAIRPVYLSTAQLIVDPRELQGVNSGATPKVDNADVTEAVVGNEMAVLKSNVLLSSLIDKDALLDDPEFQPRASWWSGLRQAVQEIVGGGTAPPAADARRIAVIAQLEAAIAVQRKERSFEIDLSVRTQSADKSAKLANDLVALYIAQTNASSASLNARLGTALQDRLSDLQVRARQADQRVEEFRIAHRLVSTEGILTSDLRLRSLTDQLAIAQIREDQDRAAVAEVDRAGDAAALGTAPEAVQSQGITLLRGQLTEAMRRRSTLAMHLGPRHPDLVAADDEVRLLQRLLDQELRRLADATKNRYGRSKENALNIRKDVDSLSERTLNNSSSVAQLRQLELEAEAARTLFTAFLSRSRELSEQTQVYITNVRQIGFALPALNSAGLPTSLVAAASLAVGLVLGALMALAVDTWEWRPRTVAIVGRRSAA